MQLFLVLINYNFLVQFFVLDPSQTNKLIEFWGKMLIKILQIEIWTTYLGTYSNSVNFVIEVINGLEVIFIKAIPHLLMIYLFLFIFSSLSNYSPSFLFRPYLNIDMQRSVNLRMTVWCHQFSKKNNAKNGWISALGFKSY